MSVRSVSASCTNCGHHARNCTHALGLPYPTLSIECELCSRYGRYKVAKFIEQFGDAKLPDLRHVLAKCRRRRDRTTSATGAS